MPVAIATRQQKGQAQGRLYLDQQDLVLIWCCEFTSTNPALIYLYCCHSTSHSNFHIIANEQMPHHSFLSNQKLAISIGRIAKNSFNKFNN